MGKIRNYNNLANAPLRKAALDILEAGLEAIDTRDAIRKNVGFDLENKILRIVDKEISLKTIKKIFVVCVGKCSLEAGEELEKILGRRLGGGIAFGVHVGELKKIKYFKGDHPLPSANNVEVTAKIIELLSDLNKDDLVIMVISGGGTVLLSQPQGLTVEDEIKIVDCLLKSGADIKKMNTVRKHMSLARGGNLAKFAYPAKMISLIFSDVIGDDLQFVASGPTMMDTTTLQDAENILREYSVHKKTGLQKIKFIETPKHEKYFKNVDNFLVVSNSIALKSMVEEAKLLGFNARIVSSSFHGEAATLGEEIAKNLEKEKEKTVLIYGGESTVTVKGGGKGGRNQEVVLSAARFIKEGEAIASLNTDGRDNCELAGAICDIITKIKIKNLGLDVEKYLRDNDSYNFFTKTGDYLLTGDTGSNVADIIVAIKNKN